MRKLVGTKRTYGVRVEVSELVLVESGHSGRIEVSELFGIESSDGVGVEVSELIGAERTHSIGVEVGELIFVECTYSVWIKVGELLRSECTYGVRIEVSKLLLVKFSGLFWIKFSEIIEAELAPWRRRCCTIARRWRVRIKETLLTITRRWWRNSSTIIEIHGIRVKELTLWRRLCTIEILTIRWRRRSIRVE